MAAHSECGSCRSSAEVLRRRSPSPFLAALRSETCPEETASSYLNPSPLCAINYNCRARYLPELDGAVVRGEHAQGPVVRPRAPPHLLDLLADLQAVQRIKLCDKYRQGHRKRNACAKFAVRFRPAHLMNRNSSIDRWLTSGSWLWNSVAKLYLGGGPS